MALLMQLTMYLTGLNILLIIGLLYVYGRNLKKFKSLFTLGLFIFAALFLLQNIVSFYYYITMMPLYAQGLEMHVFIFTLLQALAFLVMNYITWK